MAPPDRGIGRIARVGWIAARLAGGYLPSYWLTPPSGRAALHARLGAALSRAFQSLGGVYVKLGQLLSMRGDLLPPEMLIPLQALLDRPTPEPFEVSLRTIKSSLGEATFEGHILSVQQAPIGAGSFATVYVATLTSGELASLKVRRDGVERIVRTDLILLKLLAGMLDASLLFGRFRFAHFYERFHAWTVEELDYEIEGRSISHLRGSLPDGCPLRIPAVNWELTRSNLLVTDVVRGLWLSDWLAEPDVLSPAGRKLVAANLMRAFLVQVFHAGFFHADPHPGNICIDATGAAQLIDFGLSSFADASLQDSQRTVFQAFKSGDVEQAVQAILGLLYIPPDADVAAFRTEFVASLRAWLLLQRQPGLPAERRSATLLMLSNFNTTRRHGLIFRTEMALYYRALMILDRLLVALNPDMNYVEEISAFFDDDPWADVDRQVARIVHGLGLTGRLRALADMAHELIPKRDAEDAFFSLGIYRASQVSAGGARVLAMLGVVGIATILSRHFLGWPSLPTDPGAGRTFSQDVLAVAIGWTALWMAARYLARWLWVRAYDPHHWRLRRR